MKSPSTILTLSLQLLGLAAWAQTPVPVGSEFLVNSYTNYQQNFPTVATDEAGNFVVVWDSWGSYDSDYYRYSIQGQRFNSAATPLGDQFQVNSYTPFGQVKPELAMSSNGDFVVVWQSNEYDNYYAPNIRGQRFGSDGSPLGGEFLINSYSTSYQMVPKVAVAPGGEFIVVWDSYGTVDGTDTSGSSVLAQFYDSAGDAVGDNFQINNYTLGNQRLPAVSSNGDGRFTVVWQSNGSFGVDTDLRSIQAQFFSTGGSVIGANFEINTFTFGNQIRPVVATDRMGNFTVVWDGEGPLFEELEAGVRGRRFEENGTPLGSDFQINTYTDHNQQQPAIAYGSSGEFMVVWTSRRQKNPAEYMGQFGQLFAPDGAPSGSEFLVNSYTPGSQVEGSVAAAPGGHFIVVWSGYSSLEDSYYAIVGQRFVGPFVFADGFETEDTSIWSSTSP